MWKYLAALLIVGSNARADGIARSLADDGAFTPGFVGARDHAEGHATLAAGWSGASNSVSVDAFGEMRVIDRVRLVLRVTDAFGDKARPGVGAAVPLLDEDRHGISATGYVMYKAEGFSEPEGEVEATLALAKHLGPVCALLNGAYGQDPEAADRDAELALATQVEARSHWFAGVAARYRDALGTTKEMFARDGFGGVSSTYAFAGAAVTVMGGIGMIESTAGVRRFGPEVTLAIGAGF